MEQPKEGFKLSKFKKVPAKVTEYNGTLRRLAQQSAAEDACSLPMEEPQETDQGHDQNDPQENCMENQEN